MASVGKVLRIPERQQDAVTAISGSGPAYIFFVVESMIEAGVHLGLPRATATDLVVQTLVGSAKMLRETGTHPTVLREQVTSPGGTTAAALRELEIHKVRAAFLAAMEAARDRSRELADRLLERSSQLGQRPDLADARTSRRGAPDPADQHAGQPGRMAPSTRGAASRRPSRTPPGDAGSAQRSWNARGSGLAAGQRGRGDRPARRTTPRPVRRPSSPGGLVTVGEDADLQAGAERLLERGGRVRERGPRRAVAGG